MANIQQPLGTSATASSTQSTTSGNISINTTTTSSSAPHTIVPITSTTTTSSSPALDSDSEASLIHLAPRPSTANTTTPYVEDDSRRCWVCYSTEAEDLQTSTPYALGEWKSPCRCSLVAHEKCLLNWIASEYAKGGAAKIECPQCKTKIKFKEEKSVALSVLDGAARVANATVPLIILCGIGSAVVVGCTIYGVNSVYLICGTDMANRLLLSPNRDFQWTWRLGAGLPLIPFVLVGSRTRIIDATLPVLPFLFFCHQDPLHFTLPPSPAVTLALLPYLRSAYYSFWDKFVKPHEDAWVKAIEPAQADDDNDDQLNATQNQNQRDGGAADLQQRADGGRNRQQQQGWQGEVVVENHNIMVQGSNVTNSIVGALLLPSVSALMGSLLGRVPALRKRLPEAFHRSIAGGCIFIILKDCITLYYKFKRAQQHRSRMIMNYQKSKAARLSRTLSAGTGGAAQAQAQTGSGSS